MSDAPARPLLPRIPLRFVLAFAGLALGLWFLRRALAPFFAALVLAYLLGPLVEWFSRRMPRTLAVWLVLLGFVGVVLGVLMWLVPMLAGQLRHLAESLPRWKAEVDHRALPWMHRYPYWAGRLKELLGRAEPDLDMDSLLRAGIGVLGTLMTLLSAILVPVILYYLLMDGQRMLAALARLVPPRHRGRVDEVVLEIHRRLGGYIRGELAVVAVVTVAQGLALQLLGVPYAWLLGVVAGLSSVVPYLPYFTALAPALVLVALEGAGWGRLGLIATVYLVVQKVEGFYLTPTWVGRASKLHPLEVLLAMLVFGHSLGFLGLIFAVPLMIVVRVLAERALENYRRHPWFQEDPLVVPPES